MDRGGGCEPSRPIQHCERRSCDSSTTARPKEAHVTLTRRRIGSDSPCVPSAAVHLSIKNATVYYRLAVWHRKDRFIGVSAKRPLPAPNTRCGAGRSAATPRSGSEVGLEGAGMTIIQLLNRSHGIEQAPARTSPGFSCRHRSRLLASRTSTGPLTRVRTHLLDSANRLNAPSE